MLKWLIISHLCAKLLTLLIPYRFIRVYSIEYNGHIWYQNMTDFPFARNLHIKQMDIILSYKTCLFEGFQAVVKDSTICLLVY